MNNKVILPIRLDSYAGDTSALEAHLYNDKEEYGGKSVPDDSMWAAVYILNGKIDHSMTEYGYRSLEELLKAYKNEKIVGLRENREDAELESLYQETRHYWGELENMKSGKCMEEAVAMKEGIAVMTVQPKPLFSPQDPKNSPINLPGAIRHYLKARGIWQTIEGRFVLNDEVSRQVRKDALRFGIEEKHRMGI